MKANIDKTKGQEHKVWFIAENADDIYTLGQLAAKVGFCEKGITLENKISLGIQIDKLLEKAIEEKINYED